MTDGSLAPTSGMESLALSLEITLKKLNEKKKIFFFSFCTD